MQVQYNHGIAILVLLYLTHDLTRNRFYPSGHLIHFISSNSSYQIWWAWHNAAWNGVHNPVNRTQAENSGFIRKLCPFPRCFLGLEILYFPLKNPTMHQSALVSPIQLCCCISDIWLVQCSWYWYLVCGPQTKYVNEYHQNEPHTFCLANRPDSPKKVTISHRLNLSYTTSLCWFCQVWIPSSNVCERPTLNNWGLHSYLFALHDSNMSKNKGSCTYLPL